MASQEQLLQALQNPYDRVLFATKVLNPIFGAGLDLYEQPIAPGKPPNATEERVIRSVQQYAAIALEDDTNVICYEIELQPSVRIDQSRVAIQHYVRKLVLVGEAALINFIAPHQPALWRLTLVAKDSELTESGVEVKATHTRRYTFLVETNRPNRTLAERLEKLAGETSLDLNALVRAFSVERMSKEFFDEYKHHYQNFVCYLTGKRLVKQRGKWIEQQEQKPSEYLRSIFNGSEKDARDFCKKLLGRIVFLYFVQKKRWLGASTTDYTDGAEDFVYQIFNKTGGNANFFPIGLTELFFDVLNKPRSNDNYTIPGSGKSVKMPYLNGGLFTRDRVDELLHKKGNMMTFPPDLFSNPDQPDTPLKRGFLDFLNAYNFTVYEDSPNDHTVAVDPEMLGHIFENLLEDNKDKGTFYTPQEIVSYMCRESLIEYLTTHLSAEYTVYQELGNEQVQLFGNEQRVGQLALVQEQGDRALKRSDVVKIVADKEVADLTQAQLRRIDELLNRVKICDPAIGSGAFPMGLLQEIFATKEMIAQALEQDWNPARVKENIIQHSIYGVDIEQGAVDIARLRFWLSLIVDIEQPKALPNLDYKIVVGDSLLSKFEDQVIEVDWKISKKQSSNKHVTQLREALATFVKKKQAFFQLAQNDKKALATDIRHHKLGALIEQAKINKDRYFNENPKRGGFDPTAKDRKFNLEREIKLKEFEDLVKQLQHLQQHPEREFVHFDWQLDFAEILNPTIAGENAGFDVVIGNPPYVQLQKEGGKLAELYEGRGFATFARTGDIYALFYEKGRELLREKGVLTFITSDKWMRAGYGKSLRAFFSKLYPMKLIELGEGIFETATVNTNILTIKNTSVDKHRLLAATLKKKEEIYNLGQQSLIEISELDETTWNVLSRKEQAVKKQIEKIGCPLKEWDVSINYGIKTGYNEAFIISTDQRNKLIAEDQKSAEITKPLLEGKDIKKYKVNWADQWIIGTLPSLKIDISDYPAIETHMKSYGKRLDQSGATGSRKKTKHKWYETQDSVSYHKEFEKEKIVWGNLATQAQFAIADKGVYINAPSPLITPANRYLLAVLNSKVGDFYIRLLGVVRSGGFFEYKPMFVEQLPVPLLDKESQAPFTKLVDYILWLYTQELSDLTDKLIPAYFEQIIDGLVYELYFPDLLKKHERQISPHLGELPAFTDDMNEEEKMRICRAVFTRLNDEQHPVRNHLFYLRSIPEIAIIEGHADH